jgi:kynurenine formamidase
VCLPGTVEAVRARVEHEGLPRINRRAALAGAAGAGIAAALPATVRAHDDDGDDDGRRRRIQDLTHVFREGFPVFAGPEPKREDLFTFAADGYYSQLWTFGEHSGTHMDAPGHFVQGARKTPDITPQELVLPLAVVDISERAARDPNAMVTTDDLRRFERRNGRFKRGSLVAMNSGWDAKVNDPVAFKGGATSSSYSFPGWSEEAARWLLEERDAGALGVDTISLDPGNSTTFPVHLLLLGADRYGLENLANLGEVKPRGMTAVVGVVPWEQGSGGPARVMAIA